MKATRARIEADPALKARHDEAKRQAWADPEKRRRKSEAVRAQWADPEMKAAMLAKRAAHPPVPRKPRVLPPRPPVARAGRANIAAGVKAAWRDPAKRAAMIEGRRVALGKPKVVRAPRPPTRPAVISAKVLRWTVWFLAAGWSVAETAKLFGLKANDLGEALDRPDRLERSAA